MSSTFDIKDGLELYNEKCPDKEYLVDEIIGKGDLVVLAGDTGLGKSIIAHQIGVFLATGEEEVLGFEIPRVRRVLYLNFELSNDEFNRRHRKIASSITSKSKLKNFQYNVVNTKKGLFDDNWDRIIKTIENSYPFDLIIVDNLYTSTSVNDEKNHDLKKILRKITDVSNVHGSAVLVITHHRKHSTEEPLSLNLVRGGSTLTNAMDMVLQLGRSILDHEIRYFMITKNRYYSPNLLKSMELILDPKSLRMINTGEINERKHLSPLNEDQNSILKKLDVEFTTSELKTQMIDNGYSERVLYDWLKKWLYDDHITKISQGKYQKN